MLSPPGEDALAVLFDPESPLLSDLGAALAAAHPNLFQAPQRLTPRQLLNVVKRDAASRGPRPGPPVIRGSDPQQHACVPAAAGLGGWFTAHAFRIARVYDEVRQHRASMEGAAPDPTPCTRAAQRCLNRWFRGDRTRAADALQAAFERALERAGTFDCNYPFCPWFLRLLGNVSAELGADDAHYVSVAELPDDPEAPAPGDPVVVGATEAERLAALAEEGIEVTPEYLQLAAERALARRGVSDPPGTVVEREAKLLGRYYDALARRPADPDEVELNLYELYVGYGNHRDYTRAVQEGDPARAVLSAVLVGIGELIRQQERSDRGERRDLAETRRTPHSDTVSLLAWMQGQLWGLLNGRTGADPVWHAADNLRWLSWRWSAAALLALCHRYAARIGDPALDPLLAALRSGDWLSNIRPDDRNRLAALMSAVCPGGAAMPTPEAGAARLLAVGLCLAAKRTRSGRALARRLCDEIEQQLPGADWGWWISRTTGRDRSRADEGARILYERV